MKGRTRPVRPCVTKNQRTREVLSLSPIVVHLKSRQRRQLLRWAEQADCPLTLRRCLAVSKDLSCRAVARQLLCAVSTVVNAVHRFVEGSREALSRALRHRA
jgi:hypothetical protein